MGYKILHLLILAFAVVCIQARYTPHESRSEIVESSSPGSIYEFESTESSNEPRKKIAVEKKLPVRLLFRIVDRMNQFFPNVNVPNEWLMHLATLIERINEIFSSILSNMPGLDSESSNQTEENSNDTFQEQKNIPVKNSRQGILGYIINGLDGLLGCIDGNNELLNAILEQVGDVVNNLWSNDDSTGSDESYTGSDENYSGSDIDNASDDENYTSGEEDAYIQYPNNILELLELGELYNGKN